MSVGGLMEKKEENPIEGEKTFCEAKQAKSANLPERGADYAVTENGIKR
jgi:hypothetical protein